MKAKILGTTASGEAGTEARGNQCGRLVHSVPIGGELSVAARPAILGGWVAWQVATNPASLSTRNTNGRAPGQPR